MNRSPRVVCRAVVLAGALLCLCVPLEAGQEAMPTLTRDAQGRATVRAVRLTEPLRVDGRLDEEIFSTTPPASGFLDTEPVSGRAAEEQTDVWVLFDDENVYVVARCWESRPERRVANEMRRDNAGVLRGDHFAVSLDTFFDRRSAVVLNINSVGGRMDGQVAADGQYNGDWNPVWHVATADFDGGWSVEAVFPFKTLRYRDGRDQTWGFNARRRVVWNNEIAYLSAVPAGTGSTGTTRPYLHGTLVDLQAPPAAHNVELKPYTVASVATDRTVTPRRPNDVSGDIGLDAKYGITQSLTANFTLNTDFAQVEADEQQVNLTRFSLFFPEKREFFLENYGLFGFGGVGSTSAAGDVPVLFYSRRIGLHNGREVPIRGGGRLVGQMGRFTVGAVNMESGRDDRASAAPTNFTAVRLRRDILRRSNLGVIFTNRSLGQAAAGAGQTYGADATFGFFANLSMHAYWARTESGGRDEDNESYRGQFNYNGDRYGLVAERLVVGSGFNPDVGFVRRADIRKSSLQMRFSPRPRSLPSVRKFSYTGTWARIDNGSGRREMETWEGEFGGELQNTDTFEAALGGNYEFIPRPFAIAPGIVVPVRGYQTTTARAGYNFGRQRPLSGNVTAQYGTFYSGHLAALGVSQGRINVSNQLSVEPTVSINWVRLVEGSFTTRLVGSRVTYTISPQTFTSALVQYNSTSHSVSANVRLRWEYRPGSELFIVFNEQRDTWTPGFPDTANRAFVVKVNRLLSF
jgi:hypothetical protein